MPPVWFEQGYRLTSTIYKRVSKQKLFHEPRRLLRNQIESYNRTERRHMQVWLNENVSFWPKQLWLPQLPYLNPFDFSLWTHIKKISCKIRHSHTDKLKASMNCEWLSMRKGFIGKVSKSGQSRLERVIPIKVAAMNNLMSLCVNISLSYKSCLNFTLNHVNMGVWILQIKTNRTFAKTGGRLSIIQLSKQIQQCHMQVLQEQQQKTCRWSVGKDCPGHKGWELVGRAMGEDYLGYEWVRTVQDSNEWSVFGGTRGLYVRTIGEGFLEEQWARTVSESNGWKLSGEQWMRSVRESNWCMLSGRAIGKECPGEKFVRTVRENNEWELSGRVICENCQGEHWVMDCFIEDPQLIESESKCNNNNLSNSKIFKIWVMVDS